MPERPPLSETHPEIAAEAMFDATTVTAGSNSKLPWKCAAHGHKWEAVVSSRTGANNSGCPVCSNKKVLAGFNDLQTTHPDIAQEADFDPTTIVAGSGKKMSWKCAARRHEWEAVIHSRTRRNQGCPVCSNNKVLAGYNDLQTTHPEVAAEAMFDATTVVAGSNKKMPWKCAAHGHKWEAVVAKRTGRNDGCPVCSGQQALIGFNDLQTTHPDLAREADFDPTTVTAGSNSKLPWKCTAHGHEWEALVSNRTSSNRTGCPVCSGKNVLAGFNDLQTTHPDLAREADFDPTTVTAGSNSKLPWKCTAHGHEWEAVVTSRTGDNKNGCPVCSNNQVLAGFNDLQTTHPDIAREADFDPTTVTAGSDKKMPWKCAAHGHKWEAAMHSRTGDSKTGCPICSNYKLLTGFNDLQTTHPEVAAEAMFDATTVVAGSSKKMPWKCTAHGHEWEALVCNRTGDNKNGCPMCTDSGFNPGDPAWLYLARHPEWRLQQIGITNHVEDRLNKHASNGWEILDVRGPMDGFLTQKWEASILRWLTSRNIPRAASGTEESPHFDTPNSGEAWQQSDLNVTSVREIMDLVEADEQ